MSSSLTNFLPTSEQTPTVFKPKTMREEHGAGFYTMVHKMIKDRNGSAFYCMMDETHKSKRYEWANISRDYWYEDRDWIMLCASCHRIFDRRNMTLDELWAWNKSKKLA